MILMDDVKEQFGNVAQKYDSQRKYLIPCFNDFYKNLPAAYKKCS